MTATEICLDISFPDLVSSYNSESVNNIILYFISKHIILIKFDAY